MRKRRARVLRGEARGAVDAAVEALRQRLHAEPAGAADDIAPYRSDFSVHLSRAPRAVVQARSEEDLAATLAFARQEGIAVSMRGAGHSCRGQTLSEGGIVLEYFDEGASFAEVDGEHVEVPASARWSALERALNGAGRACPVLTNYMDFAVGGTLSVGGYGFSSIRQGSQADQVRSLRLVLPDGRVVDCSDHENRELFTYALCGAGQVGALSSVVMRTVPRRERAQMWWYKHRSVQELHEVIRGIAAFPDAPFDEFSAVVFPTMIESEFRAAPETRGTARQALLLHAALPAGPTIAAVTEEGAFEAAERVRRWTYEAYPDHHRLWTDYKLSPEGAVRLLQFVHEGGAERKPESTYVLAIRKGRGQTSFPMSSVAHIDGPLAFSVGTFHMVPRSNPRALEEAKASLRATLAMAVELGGRPYLYGYNEMDEGLKKKLYGEAHTRLCELRSELDPDGLFNRGSY